MQFAKLCIVGATVCLGACSSIQSIRSPGEGQTDGLTYYMPTQAFLITLTVKSGEVTNIELSTSASFADATEQFLLRYAGNGFGKNELDVVVSETGLLTSAQSKTTSNVTEAWKSIAKSAATSSPSFKMIVPRGQNCLPDGAHTFFFDNFKESPMCGVVADGPFPVPKQKLMDTTETVVSNMEKSPPTSTAATGSLNGANVGNRHKTIVVDASDKLPGEAYSGVFYRQLKPYRVTASTTAPGQSIHAAAILYSSFDSKTQFLPIARTVFANNVATLSFNFGVPTGYKQDTDGELVGLFALPAEVISAYFSAVGEVFGTLGTNAEKETTAINNQLGLELASRKFEACKAALDKKDQQALDALGCNSK